ncbi:MAG: PEP-CTERM sorting domain-containing protein [Planctomycetota bacterium]
MLVRSISALLLAVIALPLAYADTTIVDDNFDSYNNDGELYAVWEPRNGPGNDTPALPDDGILSTDDGLFPGIDVQAVDHIGGSVLQHTALTPASPIEPSASQSIHLQGDIFVGNDGNSRTSIGLRNRTNTSSILELGTWNADAVDPTDGVTVIPTTTYAYRLILFGPFGGDLVQAPNWQFFPLDLALDTTPVDGEADGVVNPVDIGAGWHTYSATITDTTVTVELDLYRDGLDNGATITAGSDVAGIDSSVTWEIETFPGGYDSFRIGSPSGVGSANGVAFDNVSLTLVDEVLAGGTDTEPDGDVDGADFLALQRDNSALIGQWQFDYPVNPALGAAAVPEPTSIALILLSTAGLLTGRRR